MLDDELIRETMREKTEQLPVPPAVWEKLEQGLPQVAQFDLRDWWDRLSPVWKTQWLVFLAMVIIGAVFGLFDSHAPSVAPVSSALTVEETPVVYAAGDQPTHFEYMDRIPKAALAKRSAWRNTAADPLAELNRALAPFGYRLENGAPGMGQSLYKGDQLLAQNVSVEGRPAVSQDGTDFALPIRGAGLLRASGLWPWDFSAHLAGPAFLGHDLLEVVGVGEKLETFVVLRNGREIYRGDLGPWGPNLPLKRLAGWDGHWLVEVDGQVIFDGQSLNQQLGYAEIFDWHLIAGKPFFFFKQNGQIGISYDGQALPNRYDEVIHYRCCEPAMFNPRANDNMVWFHARKGDLWYYAEAGVYGD